MTNPQVRLLMEMLHLEKWRGLPLQVQFLSSSSLKYLAGCPPLPPHMEHTVAPLEVRSQSVVRFPRRGAARGAFTVCFEVFTPPLTPRMRHTAASPQGPYGDSLQGRCLL